MNVKSQNAISTAQQIYCMKHRSNCYLFQLNFNFISETIPNWKCRSIETPCSYLPVLQCELCVMCKCECKFIANCRIDRSSDAFIVASANDRLPGAISKRRCKNFMWKSNVMWISSFICNLIRIRITKCHEHLIHLVSYHIICHFQRLLRKLYGNFTSYALHMTCRVTTPNVVKLSKYINVLSCPFYWLLQKQFSRNYFSKVKNWNFQDWNECTVQSTQELQHYCWPSV